jgi:hypothetical protein
MSLLFLIPLATGLVTGYIFKNSAEEMEYLPDLVTAVSLILSLILAPWQLQILVLLLVIISVRRLLQQHEYRMAPKNNTQEKLNELSVTDKATPATDGVAKREKVGKYRGANYELTSATAQVPEGEIAGKYRGAPCRIRHHQQVPLQPTFELKYRGASINQQKLPLPLNSKDECSD